MITKRRVAIAALLFLSFWPIRPDTRFALWGLAAFLWGEELR